jgi:adenylate cyclase
VLPFDNLSGDPAQAYFSDGITEDIITELSRFRDLLVIARNSSFAFKGRPVDAVEAGRRLGVRFLLEGSVRRAGERVRITAQLIDVATGAHLWAERYDRTLEDVFAVQDEVAAAIAATLAGRIELAGTERAKRKPTWDLLAYDCLLRGMEHLAGYGEDANAQARAIYVEDFERSPSSPGLQRALGLAQEAVALDGEDSQCHRLLGEISLHAREFERADLHSARAVALNPNDAHAAAFRAYILVYLGRPGEAVDWIGKAMRLNPFHPGWCWNTLARALHAAGRHEEGRSPPTSGSPSRASSTSPTWPLAMAVSVTARRRRTTSGGRWRRRRTSRRPGGSRSCRSGRRRTGRPAARGAPRRRSAGLIIADPLLSPRQLPAERYLLSASDHSHVPFPVREA